MRLTYTPVQGTLKELAQAYTDSFTPRDPKKIPDFVESLIYTPKENMFMSGRYASKEEANRKGDQQRVVVQAVVLSARADCVKERGICRVHPDGGVLPPPHEATVMKKKYLYPRFPSFLINYSQVQKSTFYITCASHVLTQTATKRSLLS